MFSKKIRLDIYLAIIGFLSGIVLLALAIKLGKGIGLSFTVLISCLFYLASLYLNDHPANKNIFDKISSKSIILFLTIIEISIIGFGLISINYFYSTGHRPLWFFLIISLIAVLLAVEIF